MTAGSIAALEESLAAAWDPAGLAVLADALQAEGDPRGELIALDLHAGAQGLTPDLQARKDALKLAWLGPLGGYHAVDVDHGFLTIELTRGESAAAFEKLLELPQARTLRRLTLAGDARWLDPQIDVLAAGAVFPWLHELAILRFDMSWQPAIAGTTAKRVIAATPALAELSLRGHHVLGAFSHPSVRRLVLDNYFAAAYLRDADQTLAAMTDARIGAGPGPWSDDHLALVFRRSSAPALRRLDLSARSGGSVMSLLDGLGRMPLRRQLTHLALPALAVDYEVARLQVVVRAMKDLVEIRVPQALPAALDHPATIVVDEAIRPQGRIQPA